ncbi:MAG: hypothetical protein GY796_12400 [Chloroflexi bacterium]|nr:hypothetical protein [Chloroflexota bacterium]
MAQFIMTSFQPVSDPFPGKGPIAAGSPGFYPRAELLATIQDTLLAGDSISLVGERKAGKTSFLNYLLLNLSPTEFIPVYVDAQGIAPKNDRMFLGILARRAAQAIAEAAQHEFSEPQPETEKTSAIQLYELLNGRFNLGELRTLCFYLGLDFENLPGSTKSDKAREMVQCLQRRERLASLLQVGPQVRDDVPWSDISLPASVGASTRPLQTNTLQAAENECYLTFAEDLSRLSELLPLNSNGRQLRLIWLIDEIEVLRSYQNTELFTFLRPYAQSNPHFRFVVAGYDVLYTLSTRSEWSPFYNAFRHVRLHGLNIIEAQALVDDALTRSSISLESDLYPEIFSWTGQKPFFLKWLLSKMAEAVNGRQQSTHINQNLLQTAQELFQTEHDLNIHFSHLWQAHTTPSQQTILSWLAAQQGAYTYRQIQEGMSSHGFTGEDVTQLPRLIENLTRLKQLGFLYDQLGQYAFTSQSLQTWISRNNPFNLSLEI